MLLTEQMFRKRLFELMKSDNSYYNCVCQIIHDFELDGEEVGEWIKKDNILLQHIKDEFKIKGKNINDLF